MADRKVPRSVAELIQEYSHAKVLAPSGKVRIIGFDPFNGAPLFTRELTTQDVLDGMIRQYAK